MDEKLDLILMELRKINERLDAICGVDSVAIDDLTDAVEPEPQFTREEIEQRKDFLEHMIKAWELGKLDNRPVYRNNPTLKDLHIFVCEENAEKYRKKLKALEQIERGQAWYKG